MLQILAFAAARRVERRERLPEHARGDGELGVEVAGQLDGPSSYLMKSPHTQRPDDEARERTEEFIAKHARGKVAGGAKVSA